MNDFDNIYVIFNKILKKVLKRFSVHFVLKLKRTYILFKIKSHLPLVSWLQSNILKLKYKINFTFKLAQYLQPNAIKIIIIGLTQSFIISI